LLFRRVAADNAAMDAEPKRKRRWYQFSLRTLLTFVLICAVGSAWVAHRMDQKRREREAVAAVRKAGGFVFYEGDLNEIDDSGRIVNPPRPRGPDWLRKLAGDDSFNDPVFVSFNNAPNSAQATLATVGELDKVQYLSLQSSNITDSALANLNGLHQLRVLSLADTTVGDAGLAQLAELSKLEQLVLGRTKVTDAGLANLEGLNRLRTLDLEKTNVTDAGLERLKRLTKLEALWLKGTNVTKAGIKRLQKSLPNCEIFWPQGVDNRHDSAD
jgi:hypothetical protein